MRTAERQSEDDLGEPPSLELPQTHHHGLLRAHNDLEIYPPYPHYISESGEFECQLFDDFTQIEIKASISGSLVERYRHLSVDDRFALEKKIKLSMGRFALGVDRTAVEQIDPANTVALINNLPVIMEPLNHALLVGYWVNEAASFRDDEEKARSGWNGWQKKKMHIKSQSIENYSQQRLLLGGLATFVTYLEQQ